MTNNELIRMAKEAGLPRWYQTDEVVNMDLLGRFAALVAAHEREACAKVCEDDALSSQYGERSKYRELLASVIRERGNT